MRAALSALSTAKPPPPRAKRIMRPYLADPSPKPCVSSSPFAGYVQDDTLGPDGLGYVLRKGGVRQH